MPYAFEERALETAHKLTLDGRGRLTVSGVSDVESFDEQTVVLSTARGTLVVRGEQLHLEMLSLEGGEVRMEGQVDSLTYESDVREGGFLSRLFR